MTAVDQISAQLATAAAGDVAARSIVGKDDFLRLLITQLRNQDPMSPVEGQEFASQLAQFSSLEQLQNMNQALKSSLASSSTLTTSVNNILATTLIGRETRADSNLFVLGDVLGKASLSFSLAKAADNVEMTVLDQNSIPVETIDLGALPSGDHTVEWDPVGKGHSGELYGFGVKATGADGSSIQATPYIRGRITGVGYRDTGTTLILGGNEVPFESVRRVLGA